MSRKGKVTAYSPSVKAAVLAAILAGTSVKDAAAQYGPAEATIRGWVAEHNRHPSVDVQHLKKTTDISDLIATYLQTLMRALVIQAEVTSDAEYILRQDADKLAILHGVFADKGIAILDRLARIAELQEQRTITGEITDGN